VKPVFFLLFTLFLFCLPLKAQRDLEHWFPPIYRSASKVAVSELCFYLSTEKETPFSVNIYHNKQLLQTFQLSKSSPVTFCPADDSMILISTPRRTMTPVASGIHITGEKSFYASLRVATGPRLSSPPVADIFASKGKTALGTEFYTVMDQILLYGSKPDGMNYFASVMATKDGTQVKIDRINPELVFTNGSSANELLYSLNEGESVIIAAEKAANTPNGLLDDNDPNLIGARIQSNFPIIVSNGNFLSQDLGIEGGGNMNADQAIPVSQLGKEYFLANGMTDSDLMEKPLFVAVKDNTKIYFNDETTPFLILHRGEHYIGPYANRTDKWIASSQSSFTNSDGMVVPVRGMFIRASEPLYVYQLLGGFRMKTIKPGVNFTEFTSGMLFSYPLDKNYIPDSRQRLTNEIAISKVEEIGEISADTKLIVKTPDNARVLVNGSVINNFTPIAGKPGWSYFTKHYNDGNLIIQSSESLQADIVGGFRYAGFGSSYSAFSNDPFIIRNGNCIQEGVFLSVSNSDFASFQWLRDGVSVPGATDASYSPTQAGSYSCVCYYRGFSFTTEAVVIPDCPYILTEKDLGNYCHSFVISPRFSPPRVREEIAGIRIVTQPLSGTATVDGDAIIVRIDETFSGANRLVYALTSTTGFVETVKATFQVYPSPAAELKDALFPIKFDGNRYTYNLTESVIDNPDNNSFLFYPTERDAAQQTNSIPATAWPSYTTANTEIYIRLSNTNNCTSIKKINLIQTVMEPEITPAGENLPNFFSPDGDGINDFWDYSKAGSSSRLQLAIYDRYGAKVYEHVTGSIPRWNGKTPANEILPSGTYWVFYQTQDKDGTTITKTQWLVLRHRN